MASNPSFESKVRRGQPTNSGSFRTFKHSDEEVELPSITSDADWVEGGGVPHPTGGYTEVQVSDTGETWHGKRVDGAFVAHRTDGPAFVDADGNGTWHVDGIQETTTNGVGPAWETGTRHIHPSGGYTEKQVDPDDGTTWFGKLNTDGEFVKHRLDGPAYVDGDGYREWYDNGTKIQQQQLPTKRKRYLPPGAHPKGGYNLRQTNDDGETFYGYLDPATGEFVKHRLDGPAFEDDSGNSTHYRHGVEVQKPRGRNRFSR